MSNQLTTPAIKELTLSNGLKIIVNEDRRTTQVHGLFNYNVGSRHDSTTGLNLTNLLLATFYENFRQPAPDDYIPQATGDEDKTYFFDTLEAANLSSFFKFHADFMTSVVLTDSHLKISIESSKKNDLREALFISDYSPPDEFFALAFPASGYKNTAGLPSEHLERVTLEQLREWHQKWFIPNNAFMVLSGNVDIHEAQALAEQYFCNLPEKPLPLTPTLNDLAAPGERRVTVHRETQLPWVFMGFNTPDFATATEPLTVAALSFIEILIDESHLAHLPISSGKCFYTPYIHCARFLRISVTGLTRYKPTPAQLESEVWKMLDDLKLSPVSQQVLDQTRTKLLAKLDDTQNNFEAMAYRISSQHSYGLPLNDVQERQALLNLTTADIQNVASHYFTLEHLTVAHVLPLLKHA